MPGHDTAPVPGVVPAGAHSHRWRLGFKQSSLGHIARASRHPVLDASRRPSLPWHALVPLRFPLQVNQATQEHLLRVPPNCVGDTTKRLTAHTGRARFHASGSHGSASQGWGELPVGEESWLVLVYAHQPGERPGGVSPESFVFLHGPSDDVLVDAPCEEAQLGAVADSVIVDPASGHRVDVSGQAGQVRPAATVEVPGPDLLPDRLARFAADGRVPLHYVVTGLMR